MKSSFEEKKIRKKKTYKFTEMNMVKALMNQGISASLILKPDTYLIIKRYADAWGLKTGDAIEHLIDHEKAKERPIHPKSDKITDRIRMNGHYELFHIPKSKNPKT